jgi:hypothetical protein
VITSGAPTVHPRGATWRGRRQDGPADGIRSDEGDFLGHEAAEDFRCDSDMFGDGVRAPARRLIAAAMKRGLQTRDAESAPARVLGE